MPRPLQVDQALCLTLKVVSELRVKCATSVPILVFLLPRALCSRLRPDVRDRQTDVRQRNIRQTSDTHHRLMPPPYGGGGIKNESKALIAFNLIEVAVYKSLLFGLRVAGNNLPQSLQTQHRITSF